MTERPLMFGPSEGLMGVYTEPSPERARRGAPVVLAWNVGVNHRVGPYRVLVDLSRDLAARGFPSLRFDMSGRGDSAPRRDGASETERDLRDLREAMAVVAARGVPRFVLLGFCSSVDAAHRMALADRRVVGACFIEGYAHRTAGFYTRYPLRLLQAARWRRALAHRLPAGARDWPVVRKLARIPLAVPGDTEVYVREYPPAEQLRREYTALVERGTRLLFLYVGGDSSYNHRSQLFEFGAPRRRDGTVEVAFYPRADHTFFRIEDRARAVERVGRWLERWFGGETLGTAGERPAV